MIDIGVNLTGKAFGGDRGAVLDRAQAVGVSGVIVTGTTVDESRAAVALCAERPTFLHCTAGVHPHHAKDWTATSSAALRELTSEPAVVAVGECGLDYNRNYSPPAAQRDAFDAQLALAVDVRLPVFLHERDAAEDFRRAVAEHRGGLVDGVVHCFTGNEDALRAYLDLDLHIGLTGWICDERRGKELFDLARLIPSNRLLIETDAPYLLPRTIRPRPRSRRNEPAYLTWVRDRVAEARDESPQAVAQSTAANARRFFRLPQPA